MSSYAQPEVKSASRSTASDFLICLAIDVVLNRGFLVVAVLIGDRWGIANAMSMATSIEMNNLEERREELRKGAPPDPEPGSLHTRYISHGQA